MNDRAVPTPVAAGRRRRSHRLRLPQPAAPVAPVAPHLCACRTVAPVAPASNVSQAPLPVPMPASLGAAQAQTTPTSPLQQTQNAQGQRQFTGDPVTLDFQGADLRAVLRTFAEISNGLNIVIDPSIQGTVDVSLRDVPWDQALDIILRANKLGYSVDGNIVRIVPLHGAGAGERRAPQADGSAGARRRAAHADGARELRQGRRPGAGDHAQHAVGARRRAGRRAAPTR